MARKNYEDARDAVVQDMSKKGEASYDNQVRLMQDANALFVALDNAFPPDRRKDPHEFLTYGASKRYLQAMLAASHRAITTTDTRAMTGSLRFQGDSVVGLLDHMYQNGLEFAPPQPGGEGVYRAMFETMRSLYLNIGPDKPAAEAIEKASGRVDN
jgi:hypothetical protein